MAAKKKKSKVKRKRSQRGSARIRRRRHLVRYLAEYRNLFGSTSVQSQSDFGKYSVVIDSANRDVDQIAWDIIDDGASRITAVTVWTPDPADFLALKHCVLAIEVGGETKMQAPIWYGAGMPDRGAGFDVSVEIPAGSAFRVSIHAPANSPAVIAHVCCDVSSKEM